VTRHIGFLSLLYVVWGAVFGIVGLAGLALAGGAAVLVDATGTSGSSIAAGFTAVVMVLLSVTALAWAVGHVWVGRALGRHEPRARLLALGLAMVNLVFLPFGTALGIYAGWVLLTDEGRRVFHPPN
jgi:hypothetical protein